jgi:hypothetical protein
MASNREDCREGPGNVLVTLKDGRATLLRKTGYEDPYSFLFLNGSYSLSI